jgi:hypothetical protein
VAETIQNGGFGSAAIDTLVNLRSAGGGSSVTIIVLDCDGPVPRPYTLDDVANRGGTVDLGVEWVNSTHLRLTYRGHPRVLRLLQQAYGVSISAAEI